MEAILVGRSTGLQQRAAGGVRWPEANTNEADGDRITGLEHAKLCNFILLAKGMLDEPGEI
jgi:hypothetical protein